VTRGPHLYPDPVEMAETAEARDLGRGPIFRAKPKVFPGLSDKLI